MKFNKILDISEINNAVAELSAKISSDYNLQGVSEISVLWVANGAMFFAAEILKNLDVPLSVCAVSASSYKDSDKPCQEPEISVCSKEFIENKDVLIIDDIFDTGKTISAIVQKLTAHNPKSIKTCFLLNKKVIKQTDFQADYICFDIEDKFVCGYGLDYQYKFRNLKGVFEIVF